MLNYASRVGITIAERAHVTPGTTLMENYLKRSGMIERSKTFRVDSMKDNVGEARIIEGIKNPGVRIVFSRKRALFPLWRRTPLLVNSLPPYFIGGIKGGAFKNVHSLLRGAAYATDRSKDQNHHGRVQGAGRAQRVFASRTKLSNISSVTAT